MSPQKINIETKTPETEENSESSIIIPSSSASFITDSLKLINAGFKKTLKNSANVSPVLKTKKETIKAEPIEVAKNSESLIKKLELTLNKIRPEDIQRGNCLSCAAETARVLMSDAKYVPAIISLSNAVGNEKEAFGETVCAAEERYEDDQEFFGRLQSADCGSVFVASTEDHVYTIFKSNLGKMYLLDSDVHVYKQINSTADFHMPVGTMFRNHEYNYFDTAECGFVALYPIGKADPHWDEAPELESRSNFRY